MAACVESFLGYPGRRSLPAETSECERGFSQMKITKTQYRNKLRSTSMSMLMTIQLHSPDINAFDPTEAIGTPITTGDLTSWTV